MKQNTTRRLSRFAAVVAVTTAATSIATLPAQARTVRRTVRATAPASSSFADVRGGPYGPWLQSVAADLQQQWTEEFPRVYGILVDWPIGEQTATIFSSSTGAASLYTTSTLSVFTVILGGEAEMFGRVFKDGDIVKIPPGSVTDFRAITDVTTVVVKHPGAKNDKYIS